MQINFPKPNLKKPSLQDISFLVMLIITNGGISKVDATEKLPNKPEIGLCKLLGDNIKISVADLINKNLGFVLESSHGIALKNFSKNPTYIVENQENSPRKINSGDFLEEGDFVVNLKEALNNPEIFRAFRNAMMKSQREATEISFDERQNKLAEQFFQIVPETGGLNRYEVIQLLSGQIKGRENEIQEDYAKIPAGVRKFIDPLLFGIPAQETGYKQMLVSPAEAGSAWQILKSHGEGQYKKIRKNFRYATTAGLRHLKKDSYRSQWKEMLNSWNFSDEIEDEIIAYMTINAYNSGGGRLNQALTEFKKLYPDEESLKKIHKKFPITALDFFDNLRALAYLKISGYKHDSSSYVSLIIEGSRVGTESYKNKEAVLKSFEGKNSPINIIEAIKNLKKIGIHVYTSHGKYDNKYNGTEVTSLVGLRNDFIQGLMELLKNLNLESNINLIITAGTENNRKDAFNRPATQYIDGVRLTFSIDRIGLGTRYTRHTKTVRKKRHFSKMLTIGRKCRGKKKKRKCRTLRKRKKFTKWVSKKVSYRIPHAIKPQTITSENWKKLSGGGKKLWEALQNHKNIKLLEKGGIGKIIQVGDFIYEVRKRGENLDMAVYTPDFYEQNKEKIKQNIMEISELAKDLLENSTPETQENSNFLDVSKTISQYINLSDPTKPFLIHKDVSQDFLRLLIDFHRQTGRKVPLENSFHTFHHKEREQSHIQKKSFDLGRKIGLKFERKRYQKLFANLAKKYGFELHKSPKQVLAHSRRHFEYSK